MLSLYVMLLIFFITIFLGSLLTNSPFRAYLYSGLPLCFKAEKKGGICKDSPKKFFISFFTSTSLQFTSHCFITLPVASSVSVVTPSLISTKYDLSASKK